jgi:hypothetical protein
MRRWVTEKDRAETGPRALLRPSDDSVGVEPVSTQLQQGESGTRMTRLELDLGTHDRLA